MGRSIHNNISNGGLVESSCTQECDIKPSKCDDNNCTPNDATKVSVTQATEITKKSLCLKPKNRETDEIYMAKSFVE